MIIITLGVSHSGRNSGQLSSNNIQAHLTMSASRGPRLDQAACIGEEVKIGVHLAIERFRLDEKRKGTLIYIPSILEKCLM